MSASTTTRPSRRSVALAGALGALGALAASTRAFAGECPADKRGFDLIPPGTNVPKGVTDKVIGSIDLANEKVKLAGYQLRLRHFTVAPGGEVPWHSHADRPAMIYILQGTITEFTSTCADPIVHKAGDLAVENHDVSHWWKNTGKETVVLVSFDLFHDMDNAHMM